ncbi:hypothetical protein Hamer_G000347 [Homarus americanus]|uniref:Uncharacterized protein n=1 Tax=Homarus americanus TaxID=6706 RepID=A0A8J5NBT5_HOMAM|nr:hypothetical protein Hamer_G000347 [Homarus americanus]
MKIFYLMMAILVAMSGLMLGSARAMPDPYALADPVALPLADPLADALADPWRRYRGHGHHHHHHHRPYHHYG